MAIILQKPIHLAIVATVVIDSKAGRIYSEMNEALANEAYRATNGYEKVEVALLMKKKLSEKS